LTPEELRNTLEAALLSAGRPLSLDVLHNLVGGATPPPAEVPPAEGAAGAATATVLGAPSREEVRATLVALAEQYAGRGIQLAEVASGFRVQVRPEYARRLAPLWEERPPRYSRALLETLALIAYRQPISRAEIEEVRGVAVSPSILKTLQEREWVRVVGHRETPGRPALYGTTRQFLDDFNLRRLADLPPLLELREPTGVPGDLFAELEGVAAGGDEESAEGVAP
jgi:segregation and condensation protein B